MKHPIHKKASEDGVVVFALSILYDAKQDAQMWNEFNEEFPNWNPSHTGSVVGEWVGEWLARHPKEARLKGISRADVKAMNKYPEEIE